MNRFRAQVAGALEAATIHPSGSCSWFGRRLPRMRAGMLPAAAARAHLTAVLGNVLYDSFYCHGTPVPLSEDEARAAPHADPAFVAELSAANAGQGCWAGGWRVDGRCGEDLVLVKDRLRLIAKRSQTRILEREPSIGGLAQIRLPKELAFAAPGFYTVVSDTDLPAESGQPMLRLYFNLFASAAACLVAALTSALNGIGIAFRLKVVDAPERFSRCDAAVLYLDAGNFEPLRPVLRDVASRPGLRELTPAFTKPLAPGIGLAEDPATGESFGSHRCRLLAEGVISAHHRGTRSPAERLTAVEAHFASQRVDLETPYLAPGSFDRYAL
jgi:HopA1 effector protein family